MASFSCTTAICRGLEKHKVAGYRTLLWTSYFISLLQLHPKSARLPTQSRVKCSEEWQGLGYSYGHDPLANTVTWLQHEAVRHLWVQSHDYNMKQHVTCEYSHVTTSYNMRQCVTCEHRHVTTTCHKAVYHLRVQSHDYNMRQHVTCEHSHVTTTWGRCHLWAQSHNYNMRPCVTKGCDQLSAMVVQLRDVQLVAMGDYKLWSHHQVTA